MENATGPSDESCERVREIIKYRGVMAMGTLEDEGYARRELYKSLFRSRHRAGSAQ